MANRLDEILGENLANINFWNRNPIGLVIKKRLIQRGNWKKRSNGYKNARLGFEVHRLKRALGNGIDIEIPDALKKYVDNSW